MVQSTVAEALPLLSPSASVHLKRLHTHSAEADMARGMQEYGQQVELVVVVARNRFRWACGVGDAQALEEHRCAMRATAEADLVFGRLVAPNLLPKLVVVVDMVEFESRAVDRFVVAL